MAAHIFPILFFPPYHPAGNFIVAVNGILQVQVDTVNFSNGLLLQRQIMHPLKELPAVERAVAVGIATMVQHLLH